MGRRCYLFLRRHRDVPIRCRGDVPLRRLGDVPRRRRCVFHLRRDCDVAGTYRETSLRRRYDVLLPGGLQVNNLIGLLALLLGFPSVLSTCVQTLLKLFYLCRIWFYYFYGLLNIKCTTKMTLCLANINENDHARCVLLALKTFIRVLFFVIKCSYPLKFKVLQNQRNPYLGCCSQHITIIALKSML